LTLKHLLAALLMLLPLAAAESKAKRPTAAPPGVSPAGPPTPAADTPSARRVLYGPNDITPIRAKVGFSTMIVLPKAERIMQATSGDQENWVIAVSENLAHLKPAREGTKTNLNLITQAGNVFSFLVSEVSASAGRMQEPDFKLVIELKDEALFSGEPRFVPVVEVERLRGELAALRAEEKHSAAKAADALEQQLKRLRSEYPLGLSFDYRFDRQKPPFNVSAVFHDGKFTFIRATPSEVPALYELKDGKPSLVQFEYRNGTYVVGKVLGEGYLAVGNKKLIFSQVR